MATTTFDAGTGPGNARTGPVFANAKGPLKIVTGTFDFDTSYPTGGEDITGIFNKFASTLGCEFFPRNGYTFTTDYTNKKVLAYQGDNTNAAAAPGVQVPNTTNLSTLTGVRFIAWGYSGASQTA